MTDQELQALRRRAYGPDADIHLDPSALERLRELEDASRPRPPARKDPEPVVLAEQESPQAPRVAEDVERDPHHVWRQLRPYVLLGMRRLARIRRSTVLIVLGLAVTTTVVIAALVLVERVQEDPLQLGAQQVARLSPDSSFDIPRLFVGPEGEDSAQGFQEFHGVRPIISRDSAFGGTNGDDCLLVLSSRDLEGATDTSFAGPVISGCGAAAFPALVQFRSDWQGLSDELELAFPDSAALQFVYDSANDEVVVFMTEAP